MTPAFKAACRLFRFAALGIAASAAQAAPFAYIANNGSASVSVIDTASNTVVAAIPVGLNPIGVAVNPAGTRVYVTNYGSNNVSVIDTSSNAVVATIPVGTGTARPEGVAVDPAGSRAYVTDGGTQAFSVIDTSSNRVVAIVSVPLVGFGVAVNPTGTRVYVTSDGATNISVIDTSSNTVGYDLSQRSHVAFQPASEIEGIHHDKADSGEQQGRRGDPHNDQHQLAPDRQIAKRAN
ncbi:MAG TPA: YncE family protein, partial [Bryobacteraceae bacterium]